MSLIDLTYGNLAVILERHESNCVVVSMSLAPISPQGGALLGVTLLEVVCHCGGGL